VREKTALRNDKFDCGMGGIFIVGTMEPSRSNFVTQTGVVGMNDAAKKTFFAAT
jgi:hypothetical protein